MKNIFLIIVILSSFIANAQKCKYQRNEVDNFTKKTIIETKREIFTTSGMGLGFGTAYSLFKSDDNKFIRFYFSTTDKPFAIKEGDNIMIKFSDDDVMSLKFSKSDISNSSYISQIKTSTYSLDALISITESDIRIFESKIITDIRVYTTDGYIDGEVNAKRAKKFQSILKCIE
ncbi:MULTISPECIES: hypothetical protein [unclassified Myroides]|uniref:hypothetical protein n=1 Tax=unclassified Myroides TaxID=2642485 RepID=UPI003D2F5774